MLPLPASSVLPQIKLKLPAQDVASPVSVLTCLPFIRLFTQPLQLSAKVMDVTAIDQRGPAVSSLASHPLKEV